MRSGVLEHETSNINTPKRKNFLIYKLIYQCNPLLLRIDLPSHPPDPVIEVVADDEASSISKVTCGLSDIFAGEVVGQRLRLCCRVSQVQKHQYLLIVRKA